MPNTQSARAQPQLFEPREYDPRRGNQTCANTGYADVDAAINGGPSVEAIHGPTSFSNPNTTVTDMPPVQGVQRAQTTPFGQHFEVRSAPLPPVDTRSAPSIPVQLGQSIDWPQSPAPNQPQLVPGRWGRGVDAMSSAIPLPRPRPGYCAACSKPTEQPECQTCSNTYCPSCESLGHHALWSIACRRLLGEGLIRTCLLSNICARVRFVG